MPTIGKNAPNPQAHQYLRQLRAASADVEDFLASLFNQMSYLATYRYLVDAHQEMAIGVHDSLKQESRDDPANEKKAEWHKRGQNFRKDIDAPGMWPWKSEVVHLYVDQAMTGRLVVESYSTMTKYLKGPSGQEPVPLSGEQIIVGWYMTIVRVIRSVNGKRYSPIPPIGSHFSS
jgi:hypothetical protein